MRTARRLPACALVALAAMASSAVAAETESTFALRFESNEGAALNELESLAMTVHRAWQGLARPGDWDVEKYGAFELVRRGADYRVKSPLPGEATVTVTIAPSEPVPSESASAQALASLLLEFVESDAGRRLAGWRTRTLSAPGAAAEAAAERVREAQELAAMHRAQWGDVATEHTMAADRLRDAAADLARTRIDLAVAAQRLEKARSAVERAAEAEDIRRRADEIERQLEAREFDHPRTAEEMRETIKALRKALAEAEKTSPPLDVSRRLVFDLEVELVGLEARKTALEPEIRELRARVVELVGAAAESREHEAELAAARSSRNAKRDALRELETRLSRAAVVVVRRPTPGAPRER